MLFTEPTFLFLFLPVLLAFYFATLSRVHGSYGNWLLLIASVIFYAKGGGTFTWLILASIAFNYWMAIAVARRRFRFALALAVGVNLTVLGIFKYGNFFAENAAYVLSAIRPGTASQFAVPDILLPIGISFFTFHAISYVVDGYRGQAKAKRAGHAGSKCLFQVMRSIPVERAKVGCV